MNSSVYHCVLIIVEGRCDTFLGDRDESKYQDLLLSQKFVRIMMSSACNIVNGQIFEKAENLGQPQIGSETIKTDLIR